MKDFSGRNMQDIILCLQTWANEIRFENSWRATMLLSVAAILESFLIAVVDE